MTCEAAEKDLLQRYSQREALATLVKPDSGGTAQKKPLRGRDIVDVSSCLSMVTTNDGQIVTPEKGFPQGDISLANSEDEDDGSLSLRLQNRFSFSEKDPLEQESTSAAAGKYNKGKGEQQAEELVLYIAILVTEQTYTCKMLNCKKQGRLPYRLT
jgi:hypothetical protein